MVPIKPIHLFVALACPRLTSGMPLFRDTMRDAYAHNSNVVRVPWFGCRSIAGVLLVVTLMTYVRDANDTDPILLMMQSKSLSTSHVRPP